MANLEEIYKEYIQRDDISIFYRGELFYRIIAKSSPLTVNKKQVIILTLPHELFKGKSTGKIVYVEDENANILELSGPAYIHFHDNIPEWYFKASNYLLSNFDSSMNIGDYLKLK